VRPHENLHDARCFGVWLRLFLVPETLASIHDHDLAWLYREAAAGHVSMVNHAIAYIGDDFVVPMLVHWDEPARLENRLVEASERSVSVVPVVRNRAARQVGDDRERPHLMTKLALGRLEQHLGLSVRFVWWMLSTLSVRSSWAVLAASRQVGHTAMDRNCLDACCIGVEFLCGR
jgi:hypothetical protein